MNEKQNKGTIVMAIYKFSGYGMDVQEYPIVNETEKSYVVIKDKNITSRIPKEEVGETIHHPSDSYPYVRVFLLNATRLDAIEKLAEWFEYMAYYIRK